MSSKFVNRHNTSRDKSKRRDALVVGKLTEELIERFSPHFIVVQCGRDVHFGWVDRIYSAVPIQHKDFAWWQHMRHMAQHKEVHFLI